jgi:hypothetical protein
MKKERSLHSTLYSWIAFYFTDNKMEKDKDSKTDSKPQRSTCEKVVETGFLVATWLALV